MKISRSLVAGLFLLVALLGTAAVAGIVSGKITAIDAEGRTVTLQTKDKKKPTQVFEVPMKSSVMLDGKLVKLDVLTEGHLASVYTDSTNTVTRIMARVDTAGGGEPTAKKKPASTKEKNEGTDKNGGASKSGGGMSKKSTSKRSKSARGGGSEVAGGDWPQFLGPNRDNISTEQGLKKNWSEAPKLLWTARGIGQGYSSISVSRGQVYTMGNVGGDEMVMALKLENGDGLWQTRSGSPFREGQGDGPRSVPTVDGDLVYSLGGNGDLTCVTTEGQVRWRKNILSDFGGSNITWGICESVLIDDDKLICTPGGNNATIVALNKQSGQVIWRASAGGKAGYASAIAMDVGGVRQYVQFTAGGTIGIRADDGRVLWTDSTSANGTANCSAPVAFGDLVFTASGYGTGGALLQLRSQSGQTRASVAFGTKKMKNHHGGMVVVDGCLYGCDEQILTCIDLKSGQVRWENRSVGKGSITCVDGNLILRSEDGPVALVSASPASYEELGRFEPENRSGRKTWPYPVVAQGRLFLRDQDSLQCYDLR